MIRVEGQTRSRKKESEGEEGGGRKEGGRTVRELRLVLIKRVQ